MSVAKGSSFISIHAAREGGDENGLYSLIEKIYISIHAAREGGDITPVSSDTSYSNFNPRRP